MSTRVPASRFLSFPSAFTVAVVSLLLSATLGASRLDAVSARSPLTLPALTFIDGDPYNRDLVSSIVRGSLATSGGGQGLAAVHLPDGARLTALSGTFLDQSASADLELRLFRRRIGTNPSTDGLELALVSSAGSSAALQSGRTEITAFDTIDNTLNVYWVAVRLEAQMELLGAQVEFRLQLFEDGFESGDIAAWTMGAPAGYVSPWVVNFADAVAEPTQNNACTYSAPDGLTGSGVVYSGVTGVACCFVAPVHLPDGVTVTAVYFYLADESADGFTMSLRRKRIGTNTPSTALGTVSTSGSSTTIQVLPDVTIADPAIDNTLYSYFVSTDTCLDQEAELRFYQAMVFYSD